MRVVFFLLCLLCSHVLCAQLVLYSSFIKSAPNSRFEVAGKTGNFYWIQKSKKSSFKKRATWATEKEYRFEIYDAHLNRVNEMDCFISDAVFEQYLVAGDAYFDQLLFVGSATETTVVLNRFLPEGTRVASAVPLLRFPASMNANDFLLVRSQDKRKILLLGFEPVAETTPRVHAILFDAGWHVLFQTIYKNQDLTQPTIQYDFTNYPLEAFDESSVKLANNGDWLAIAPSRHNNNSILFHFPFCSNRIIQSEIKLPQRAGIQTASLSLDDATQQAMAGILINSGASATKNVRIAHYLLSQGRFDFDTTYKINTLAVAKTNEENLFEQSFMPVPGKGFLFLKEYGKPYRFVYTNEEASQQSDNEKDSMNRSLVPVSFAKNDYTRFDNITGARQAYERGDLRLYYFPATPRDTCWSGLINQAQSGELNTSYLSYACMPVEGKIIFLYNSVWYNDAKSGSTTVLDPEGHALNEGLLFWKSNNILDFQRKKQIATKEIAVPYERNGFQGFAIIRL